jgi:hypothetical protein
MPLSSYGEEDHSSDFNVRDGKSDFVYLMLGIFLWCVTEMSIVSGKCIDRALASVTPKTCNEEVLVFNLGQTAR